MADTLAMKIEDVELELWLSINELPDISIEYILSSLDCSLNICRAKRAVCNLPCVFQNQNSIIWNCYLSILK